MEFGRGFERQFCALTNYSPQNNCLTTNLNWNVWFLDAPMTTNPNFMLSSVKWNGLWTSVGRLLRYIGSKKKSPALGYLTQRSHKKTNNLRSNTIFEEQGWNSLTTDSPCCVVLADRPTMSLKKRCLHEYLPNFVKLKRLFSCAGKLLNHCRILAAEKQNHSGCAKKAAPC